MKHFEQLEPRHLLTTFVGTPGDDVFSAGPGWARLNGVEYQADEVTFDGLGGYDIASLYDSPADDLFVARPGRAEIGGIKVINCEVIHGYASGGNDTARLYDSPGDDTLVTKDWAKLYGEDFYLRAKFFETVEAFASDGVDVASLNDSPGDDVAHMRPGDVTLYGEVSKRALAFDFVHTYARYGGYDTAHLYGERYTARETYTRMFGEGTVNRAKLFEEVMANRERVNALTHQPVAQATVTLVGVHTLRQPIELTAGMTLTGDATLTSPDRVQTGLETVAQVGDTRLYLDSTSFQVGDELGLFAYGTTPSWVTIAALGPDWIETLTPISFTYDPGAGAAVVNYFPLIRATGTDITIEGLTLDGNHDLSTRQWQIAGGGLIHMEATHSVIRNVTVVDAFSHGIVLRDGSDNLIDGVTVLRSRGHGIFLDEEIDTTVIDSVVSYSGYQVGKVLGDGILVNGSSGLRILGNTTEYNARYGLHPAGDLTRGGEWRDNISRYNDSNGFHFCWNNFDILVMGNTLNYNKSGVGGLGLGGEWGDRFNTIINNIMMGNRRFGVETNGGGDNIIADNDLRGNAMGSILLVGNHTVSGNLE